MAELNPCVPAVAASASVLVMSDRLITLAQEADRAGYASTAARLVHLAHAVFDDAAPAADMEQAAGWPN